MIREGIVIVVKRSILGTSVTKQMLKMLNFAMHLEFCQLQHTNKAKEPAYESLY
jgi:hypothetical protein